MAECLVHKEFDFTKHKYRKKDIVPRYDIFLQIIKDVKHMSLKVKQKCLVYRYLSINMYPRYVQKQKFLNNAIKTKFKCN